MQSHTFLIEVKQICVSTICAINASSSDLHAALSMDCHGDCNRLRRRRETKAVAAVPPLAAMPVQQSRPLSQTQAEGPAALTTPLIPHLICPKLAAVSFPGWAPCLLPQATLLQIR